MKDLKSFQEEFGTEVSLGEGSSRGYQAHWTEGKEEESR